MGSTVLQRTSQGETQEVRDALAHSRDPTALEAREHHLEALSAAQGGRWLESSTVEREGPGGYGAPGRPHVPQQATAEVKAALAERASPEFRDADEKLREARAAAQGGRWMDEGNMPAGLPSQRDQPDVRGALERAQDPAVKEEMERKRAARAAAQGGRWLD
ncbi:undecaprenyldiphospho-muramoylpentapeptide beta-N-acetylglucosaminyltransferase [Micractinium conductrix]|uniref:Undecaprenyldiphospho-muramoylpentapeptide beta-N-acetylglucosaminyltransferase n=1 Tax=Micractinium conductrix TaxID=554055 RepID=A0A2P6V784_9CHLO|nr:undecaprenyldiphospho-muramoylpentapeptide beta-N-acetylglucosaminyltransferase [Micractinium conductrix]|eukprot:PSC69938.1 undecaprenyldiphospho-muramoylpentapeptide beta-N-acetylglucosaminyltransferase [Micractinium conductrix]